MSRLFAPATLLAACLVVTATSPAQNPKPGDPRKGNPTPDKYPTDVMGKSLEAWAKDIKDNPDPSVRELAIRTVPLFGPDCRKAAAANLLHALMQEKDYTVRLTAMAYTPVIGFEDQGQVDAAIRTLVELARSSNLHTRHEAIIALAHCGQFGKAALPILKQCTTDAGSWRVRQAACTALGMLAQIEGDRAPDGSTRPLGPDISALGALIRASHDVAAEVRREALHSLLALTPPNGIKVGDLADWRKAMVGLKSDRDRAVGVMARVCLLRLETDRLREDNPTLRELVSFFHDKDAQIRLQAISGLGQLGSEGASRLRDLFEVIDGDQDPSCKVAAVWAMSQFSVAAGEVQPYLEKLKGHKLEAVRRAAEGALIALNTGKQKEDIEKKDAKDTKDKDMKKDAAMPRPLPKKGS